MYDRQIRDGEARETADEHSSPLDRPCSCVVIGYGNDLRGDDAVGQYVAMAVARWRRDGVVALATHQLTPELATWLVPATIAIFVDASRVEDGPPTARIQRIEPANSQLVQGHTGDPRALLALTQLAYGRCPSAWWITIPARHFDFGAALSPAARCGAAAALWHIRALVTPIVCWWPRWRARC
jgi:hydrogenase maturation protease